MSEQTFDPGDLGRRVARRREELGLTREEVATMAGMAPGYLEYLESRPAQPTVASILRLAHALQMPPRDLLGGGIDFPPGRGRPPRHPVLENLNVEECMRLVSPGGVGRIAFSTTSGPVVLPVNYAVVGGAVVFRTAPDTPQARHADEDVAFEVDKLDEAMSQGWSVLIAGRAQRETDPAELERLRERANVEAWPGGQRDVFVRVDPVRITGRRIRTQ